MTKTWKKIRTCDYGASYTTSILCVACNNIPMNLDFSILDLRKYNPCDLPSFFPKYINQSLMYPIRESWIFLLQKMHERLSKRSF